MTPRELVEWIYPGYFVLSMITAALNSKVLGMTLAFVVGLMVFFPDVEKANFLFMFFIAGTVLASFRD